MRCTAETVESRFGGDSSFSIADVECRIKCFLPVEAAVLSPVEAFIFSQGVAFNSLPEMRRHCHVSPLRRAGNHICGTPGLPETTLGLFEVGLH